MNDATLRTDKATPVGSGGRRELPFRGRTAGAVAVALMACAAGAVWIFSPKATVSTDAAYLEADSSAVAPKVKGLVAEVLVNHNQAVRRGDALVRIDPEEFEARIRSAQAEVQDAQAGVQAARAAIAALGPEEGLATANIRASAAVIRAADAQSARAQADHRRYQSLVAGGAVARRDVDAFEAAAVTAASDVTRSHAQLEVSRNQLEVVRAKRATLAADLARAEASVARANAALDLAKQDRDHALVRAPMDGVVGNRQVEAGDYVQPGTRLLTLVPMNALYVVANFKETQVARMLPGQSAKVTVDALPGTVLRAKVESFAPGSGSQFSLLPFEPGTGNFTKIVQRVPVRLRFEPGQPALSRLRPGLSTTVKVRLSPPAA